MEAQITPNWNEIENVGNMAVANTEYEDENSKISSEIQVETETVSNVESEIQNMNNVASEYITYESLNKERLV